MRRWGLAALVGAVAGAAVVLTPAFRPGAAPDPAAIRASAARAAVQAGRGSAWLPPEPGEPAQPTVEEEGEALAIPPSEPGWTRVEEGAAEVRPLDEPGPQSVEEIPAWKRRQRARMQAELQEEMAARMGTLGIGEERFEALLGAASAQRDALDAEEGLDD